MPDRRLEHWLALRPAIIAPSGPLSERLLGITSLHPVAPQTQCLFPQNSSAPLAEDIDPEVSSSLRCHPPWFLAHTSPASSPLLLLHSLQDTSTGTTGRRNRKKLGRAPHHLHLCP